ncbi:hypothetical protein F4810DRAFT_130629 [Camillea tinctor]|nr:hypothetical protein F4810DRAFT_130629 [Camillea tinctor]
MRPHQEQRVLRSASTTSPTTPIATATTTTTVIATASSASPPRLVHIGRGGTRAAPVVKAGITSAAENNTIYHQNSSNSGRSPTNTTTPTTIHGRRVVLREGERYENGNGDGNGDEKGKSSSTTGTITSKINREIGNGAKPESRGHQPMKASEWTQAPSQLQASKSHTPNRNGLDRDIQQYQYQQVQQRDRDPQQEPQQQQQQQQQLQLQLLPLTHQNQNQNQQPQHQYRYPRRPLHRNFNSTSTTTSSSTTTTTTTTPTTPTSPTSSLNTNKLNPNHQINLQREQEQGQQREQKPSQLTSPSPTSLYSPSYYSSSFSPSAASNSSSSSSSSSTVTPTASSSYLQQQRELPTAATDTTTNTSTILTPTLAASCISPLDPLVSGAAVSTSASSFTSVPPVRSVVPGSGIGGVGAGAGVSGSSGGNSSVSVPTPPTPTAITGSSSSGGIPFSPSTTTTTITSHPNSNNPNNSHSHSHSQSHSHFHLHQPYQYYHNNNHHHHHNPQNQYQSPPSANPHPTYPHNHNHNHIHNTPTPTPTHVQVHDQAAQPQPHALTHDHPHYQYHHHQAAVPHRSPLPSSTSSSQADDLIISPISETPPSSTLAIFRNLNQNPNEGDLSVSASASASALASTATATTSTTTTTTTSSSLLSPSSSSSHGTVPVPVPAPAHAHAPAPTTSSSSSISGSTSASIISNSNNHHPPTRDPLFGITPLLEEAGFDFEPQLAATDNPDRVANSNSALPCSTSTSDSPSASTSASPSISLATCAALSHAVAHDVAHLTTDDNRSDDWFRYTARNPTIAKDKDRKSISDQEQGEEQEQEQTMTVAMAAADMVDLPDQQQPPSMAASSSFTPLPPIRRTSTFDILRNKGLGLDDSTTNEDNHDGGERPAPSPVDRDFPSAEQSAQQSAQQSMQGEMAHSHDHINGQLSADQVQSSPHNSGQQLPHQPQPPSQNNQSQTQQTHLMQHQHHQHQQPPNGIMAATAPGQPSAASQQPAPAFAQMHPHAQQQMFMGRGGPVGTQFAPPNQWPKPGTPLMNGNPVQRFPPDSRWRLEESHLAEPLNQSHKSRSANNPPPQQQEKSNNYSAFDKETEGAAPAPSGSSSAQRYQTRQRNNSVPPSSAQRYPDLFANQVPDQQASAFQQPGQNYPPGMRGQYNDASANGARGSFDFRSSKDMGGELSRNGTLGVSNLAVPPVRVDQVSISSVTSDETSEKHRRGSGSLFGLGNRRNTGDQGNSQPPQFGTPEKKRTFFGTVTGHNQPQAKPKSNIGLAKTTGLDRFDTASTHSAGDAVPVKKRLSELKGMIKGVGNAKEGAKEAARDDQAIKFNSPHALSPIMQGSVRGAPGQPGAFGSQKPLGSPGSPPQPGQPGFAFPQRAQGPQFSNGQADPMASPPPVGVSRVGTGGSLSPPAQQVQDDEGGKRGSGGGFLGGLFHHKPASKSKESKTPSNPPGSPPGQRMMQFSPMQPGQPFRPGQMQLPGQPIGPHPMYAGQPQLPQGLSGQPGAQRAVTPDDQLSPGIGEPISPQYVQTAQAIMIRRPSEITVSQTQQGNGQALPPPRSNMAFQQSAPGAMRMSPGPSPLGSAHGHPGEVEYEEDEALKDSPDLSEESFQEHSAVANSSAMPHFSPSRKPVGSGPFRQDGHYMTPAQPPARLNERRLSEQTPLAGPSKWQEHTRQPSLPSSSNSPVPSHQSGSPALQGSGPSTERLGSTEGLGVSTNFSNQPGISVGPGPQQVSPSWAPNGLRAGPQFANIQPPRLAGSPAPSMDQSKLSKFFGAYDGGKAPANPNASKDKKAASKFFSAFKRSSKQNESNQSHQKRPIANHQHAPPQMPRPSQLAQPSPPSQAGQVGQGQVGQQAKAPAVASPPGPASQQTPQQPGMARPPMNGPPPSVPLPVQQQQQGPMSPGSVQSQVPPQVQAGRGQMPPPMTQGGGRGQMSPQQMQALSRAQAPSKPQVPGEPQYDHVPIPRGYEAVHGYGHDRILVSPSPYNVGRPSFPPPQFLQYQPMHRQPAPPGWDPRMMPPPQAGAPYGPGPIPGPVPGPAPGPAQAGPQGAMPPASTQQSPQQPQIQTPSHHSSPSLQGVPPHASQSPPLHQQPTPPQPNSEPSQGPTIEQGHAQPSIPNPVIQEPPAESRNDLRRSHSPAAQTPSSSNWGSVPESSNSPSSLQRHEPMIRTQVSPTHPGHFAAAPVSHNDARGLPTQQHIATALSSQHAHPQISQSEQGQADMPTPEFRRTSPQMQGDGSPNLHPPRSAGTMQSEYQAATISKQRSASDVTRLTSRMSISNEPPRSESLSPHGLADRAMSVSPEPSSQRQHGPVHHQVSETSMNVNIERANEFKKDAEDDIYDATPRLGSSHLSGDQDQNTKYASSEKGRAMMVNGAAAGVAVGVGVGAVTQSTNSFLEDSDTEGDVAPEVAINTGHVEPEEKILVDQPVELAAVNDDDDDGLPMMSATSYPGQEWNPYGAGEFGDWD